MSTDYCAIPAIHLDEFLDGRLKAFEIDVVPDKDCAGGSKGYITDGDNYVEYSYQANTAWGVIFTRRGGNAIGYILSATADAYNVRIVSEHSHEFWGFATEDEENRWHIEQTKIAEDKFYNEVLKFVRGEEHDLGPDTVGLARAKIAKELIAESPELLGADKRADLLNAVNEQYEQGVPRVVLTDDDEANISALCQAPNGAIRPS